jgi:uncharacterized membrane protein
MSTKNITALWAAITIILFSIGSTAFAENAGNSTLDITSRQKSLNVINGSAATLEIELANSGTAEFTDIKPQVDLPYKWILEDISPASLTLKPNESGVFTLRLSVPASQNASTHTIKIICSNGTVPSNELTIPVTVSTSPQYLWWIICGIAVLAVITLLFFKKHGRR